MRFMKIAAMFFAATSTLIMLFVSTKSQAKKQYRITGVVQDAGGKPVQGASLTTFAMDVPNGKIRWSRTDENGRFTFENVQAGNNSVCLAHEGEKGGNLLSIVGCRGEAQVSVNASDSAPEVVIVARDPNPIILGKIVDGKTKKFVRGTDIKICLVSDPSRCSGPFGTLDDQGNFTMAVPTEPFTFTVTRGEKTFKLKQKNADGIEDEVLTFKTGERRSVKISL